jgi:hypothetical protein
MFFFMPPFASADLWDQCNHSNHTISKCIKWRIGQFRRSCSVNRLHKKLRISRISPISPRVGITANPQREIFIPVKAFSDYLYCWFENMQQLFSLRLPSRNCAAEWTASQIASRQLKPATASCSFPSKEARTAALLLFLSCPEVPKSH